MTDLLVQVFKLFLSLGEIVRTPLPQGENVIYKYILQQIELMSIFMIINAVRYLELSASLGLYISTTSCIYKSLK